MHPMKRLFLIFVFSLGTVGGFSHGFLSLGHCASAHRDRRAAFEDHVAEVCTRAANRVNDEHHGWAPAGPMGVAPHGPHDPRFTPPSGVTTGPVPLTIRGPAVITVSPE